MSAQDSIQEEYERAQAHYRSLVEALREHGVEAGVSVRAGAEHAALTMTAEGGRDVLVEGRPADGGRWVLTPSAVTGGSAGAEWMSDDYPSVWTDVSDDPVQAAGPLAEAVSAAVVAVRAKQAGASDLGKGTSTTVSGAASMLDGATQDQLDRADALSQRYVAQKSAGERFGDHLTARTEEAQPLIDALAERGVGSFVQATGGNCTALQVAVEDEEVGQVLCGGHGGDVDGESWGGEGWGISVYGRDEAFASGSLGLPDDATVEQCADAITGQLPVWVAAGKRAAELGEQVHFDARPAAETEEMHRWYDTEVERVRAGLTASHGSGSAELPGSPEQAVLNEARSARLDEMSERFPYQPSNLALEKAAAYAGVEPPGAQGPEL